MSVSAGRTRGDDASHAFSTATAPHPIPTASQSAATPSRSNAQGNTYRDPPRRSMAAAVEVRPGPPSQLVPIAGYAERRTCANSGDHGARCLADAPCFEVRDAHGNAVPGGAEAGSMRACLSWPAGGPETPDTGELPRVMVAGTEMGGAGVVVEADEQGRFAFGQFEVVSGTGVFPGRAGEGASQVFSMEFALVFEWKRSGAEDYEPAFTVAVTMKDDFQRAAEMQVGAVAVDLQGYGHALDTLLVALRQLFRPVSRLSSHRTCTSLVSILLYFSLRTCTSPLPNDPTRRESRRGRESWPKSGTSSSPSVAPPSSPGMTQPGASAPPGRPRRRRWTPSGRRGRSRRRRRRGARRR